MTKEFQNICRLEIALESKSISFKKKTITPKIQSLEVKGSLCNLPILEVDKTFLSRLAANNVLATVKRKGKNFDYQGIFEALFHVWLPAKIHNLKLSFSNSVFKTVNKNKK